MPSKSFLIGQHQADFKLLLALGAASVAIVLIHLASLPNDVYWWTSDSASYIEAARSFIRSGDLLISPSLLSENEQQVIKLWPPGFPVLVAIGSLLTSLPVETTSFLIPLISWALLAPVVAYSIVPISGKKIAVWVAILSASSPGVISWGWKGLTDLPFLIVSVLSIGFFVRSSYGKCVILYAFGAGALAGLAYTIRNVGLALLASSLAAYVVAALLGGLSKKNATKLTLAFGCGAAVFVAPLIWFNISTFGALQPYRMAPSTVSLVTNVIFFIEAGILDATGVDGLFNFAAWTWWELLLFLVLCLLTIGFLAWKTGRSVYESTNGVPSTLGLLVLTFYLVAGAVIVIIARTVYQWGEMISVRHTLQYTWALLSIVFIVINGLKGKWGTSVFVMGGILTFGHVQWALGNYWGSNPEAWLPQKQGRIYAHNRLEEEIAKIPADTIIVSNYADVLRIKTRRTVRQFYPRDTSKAATELSAMRGTSLWEKRIALVLFPHPEEVELDERHQNEIQALGFSTWWTSEGVSILMKPAFDKKHLVGAFTEYY